MLARLNKPILCLSTFLLLSNFLSAQLSSSDSSFLQTGIKNVLRFYDQNIGEQSGKFNGSQNIGYSNAALEKNPYFNSSQFSAGTILYHHVYYENINLLYDEVADLVILQDSSHKIELISERLQAFTIGDAKFKFLGKEDDPSNSLPRNGFYQVLVDKKVGLYKKEIKKLSEKIINSNELSTQLDIFTHYYIQKNKQFFEIQRKSTVFQLLKDREKEIKKYIKSQHLSFRKNKDYMLTSVVEYYNRLTN